MTIQHYTFKTSMHGKVIYQGKTHFGFLSPENLARQEGLKLQEGLPPELLLTGKEIPQPYPQGESWPQGRLRMLDEILLPVGEETPKGLTGRIWGRVRVHPGAWFFAAHFPQDPVWPGSLGLEGFLEAAKVLITKKFMGGAPLESVKAAFTSPLPGVPHSWLYRGQIIPTSKGCLLGLSGKFDPQGRSLVFKGVLFVDKLPIYHVDGFSVGFFPR
jgi:3-hydroxymyristoyl/3-hydroxydecanoyl-(acyl carrier protein) dehydratase